jgi:hypothetical protein
MPVTFYWDMWLAYKLQYIIIIIYVYFIQSYRLIHLNPQKILRKICNDYEYLVVVFMYYLDCILLSSLVCSQWGLNPQPLAIISLA